MSRSVRSDIRSGLPLSRTSETLKVNIFLIKGRLTLKTNKKEVILVVENEIEYIK